MVHYVYIKPCRYCDHLQYIDMEGFVIADNLYDEMSLSEFITLPDTVSFYSLYTPRIQDYVSNRPYIRLGQVLVNEIAIFYTSERYMNEIFKDLGSDFLNVYPEIYGLTGRESLEAAGILRAQQQPYIRLSGHGVIVGIIDTGIDYTLPVFKYENNTSKIKYIWDQTINSENPNDVNFGSVYTQRELDEALQSDNPFDIVPHRDEDGHGTFLASIAAGREYGEYIGAAPDTSLIVVKLRGASKYYREKFLVPSNQKNAYESTDIMIAIDYITKKASQLRMPCVICLGLGTNFGGHNGQNKLEQYVSFLSNVQGFAICTGVGSESNARHHTEGIIERTGDVQSIEVRVGDNADSLSVYVWYEGWDKISFSLKSPTGELINRIPFFSGTTYEKKLIIEKSTVSVLYHQNESRFAVIQVRDVVPGTWEIRLHGDAIISGRYHAWLPMTGFISPDVEFISPTPNYTTVIPSTARGIISVGAYNEIDNSLYINSSWGPSVDSIVTPDFVAPGVSVQGYYPRGEGNMTGTSVSSAITSGAVALLLQWGIVEGNAPSLTGNRIRTVLIRSCDREATREYPNPRWGYGTLNFIEVFNIFREE